MSYLFYARHFTFLHFTAASGAYSSDSVCLSVSLPLSVSSNFFFKSLNSLCLIVTKLCTRDLYVNTQTRGQSNLTKSASRGPIPRLGVTLGVEICTCTIEFLG